MSKKKAKNKTKKKSMHDNEKKLDKTKNQEPTCSGPAYSNQYLISSGGVSSNNFWREIKSWNKLVMYDGGVEEVLLLPPPNESSSTVDNLRWCVVVVAALVWWSKFIVEVVVDNGNVDDPKME